MHIQDLDEVKHLAYRYSILSAMTEKTLPSLTIKVGAGTDLVLGLNDEDFLSDLADLLHEQLQKVKLQLEDLGVEFPEPTK